MKPWGLHWFRRDLRICGNAALKWNWKEFEGQTLGIFCFDSNFLSRSDFSANRFAFFLETLSALRDELNLRGGDLLVMDNPPRKAFEQLFFQLKKSGHPLPTRISWNRDYEPFARQRDEQMKIFFEKDCGITTHTERDHLILEPNEVMKESGPYGVYTPFYNKWRLRMNEPTLKNRIDSQAPLREYYQELMNHAESNLDSRPLRPLFTLKWNSLIDNQLPTTETVLAAFKEQNQKQVTVPIPKAGALTAYQNMIRFSETLPHYKDRRDIPSLRGTSSLAPFLKNGSITTSQIVHHFQLLSPQGPQQEQFLKELVWREFYYSILYHHPEVENQSYNKKYINLKWSHNKSHFQRWCDGTTGFPIVDAGMRQLNKTGWMHNRVRMIVASFLTKDLLIDWQWGAEYFMKMLLDGDLAPNNGGWQWAASTGCDPQPYFRIFNPWLQSSKFDPEGSYIKEYVPELRNAQARILHEERADRSSWGYPAPMVQHARQRGLALEMFKT